MTKPKVYFGCPMWSHSDWFGSLFPNNTHPAQALSHYAALFNSVEGNTSFYQIPSTETASRWAESVPAGFRFTFKFNQEISHTCQLSGVEHLVEHQLAALSPIKHKLGCMLLQLPAAFSPAKLAVLDAFLAALPDDIRIAVEVRHLDFFDKSENETALNRSLIKHRAARVIMDTRGLFSVQQPDEQLIKEVQGKKPKVPTHVISTSDFVIVRYVGHPQLDNNRVFYKPWLNKLHEWIEQDKTVYFFMHMPDNSLAPWLAEMFIADFNQQHPEQQLPRLTLPKLASQQNSLF